MRHTDANKPLSTVQKSYIDSAVGEKCDIGVTTDWHGATENTWVQNTHDFPIWAFCYTNHQNMIGMFKNDGDSTEHTIWMWRDSQGGNGYATAVILVPPKAWFTFRRDQSEQTYSNLGYNGCGRGLATHG